MMAPHTIESAQHNSTAGHATHVRPLRVLLISSSSGSQGGGELYLTELARQLQQGGHQIEILLSSHPRMDGLAALAPEGLRCNRADFVNTYDRRWRGFSAPFDGRASAVISPLVRRIAPDIVHLNKQNVEDGLDLVRAVRKLGIPFVTTIHITRAMTELGAVGGRWRDWLSRRSLNYDAGHFIAIADSCRSELADYLKNPCGATVHLVRNGVSPAPLADRCAIRREWNCREQDFVIGCVARIEAQKNPLFAVRLLQCLPEHVRFVWVGDGRLRGELEAAAVDAGVASRLHIDGWRTDARERMAGFDVFALPSLFEGLPLAILEAMSAGLPCLVSNTDGTSEAVSDRVTGRLLPADDLEAWVSAANDLIRDHDLRAKMAAAATDRWRNELSLQAMADRTVVVYRQVIAEAKSRD